MAYNGGVRIYNQSMIAMNGEEQKFKRTFVNFTMVFIDRLYYFVYYDTNSNQKDNHFDYALTKDVTLWSKFQ